MIPFLLNRKVHHALYKTFPEAKRVSLKQIHTK